MSQQTDRIQRHLRSILIFIAVAFASAAIALAQPATTFEVPIINSTHSWQTAQAAGSSQKKVVVITLDQPDRRQSCRVQSFTADKLACSRGLGRTRTYLPQQIAAVIVPGFDERLRLPMFLGINGGLGAAIWATVALAAACPVCAVGAGIAALICFAAAGTLVYGDGQPDRLLYLAPGQKLSSKFRSVEP